VKQYSAKILGQFLKSTKGWQLLADWLRSRHVVEPFPPAPPRRHGREELESLNDPDARAPFAPFRRKKTDFQAHWCRNRQDGLGAGRLTSPAPSSARQG